jgi:hypothetical protein
MKQSEKLTRPIYAGFLAALGGNTPANRAAVDAVDCEAIERGARAGDATCVQLVRILGRFRTRAQGRT